MHLPTYTAIYPHCSFPNKEGQSFLDYNLHPFTIVRSNVACYTKDVHYTWGRQYTWLHFTCVFQVTIYMTTKQFLLHPSAKADVIVKPLLMWERIQVLITSTQSILNWHTDNIFILTQLKMWLILLSIISYFTPPCILQEVSLTHTHNA